MADKNMKAKMNVEFTEATSRQSIESGDSVNTLFGKIKKFFSDLKSVAFSGSYNDLSDKPTIPTKTSQLANDSGYKTTDNNTTYSLSKSGTDIILTGSDGSKTSVADTNTWRGIQDNLTSTSTTDSLSANQGKVLNEKIDGIQVGGRNLLLKTAMNNISHINGNVGSGVTVSVTYNTENASQSGYSITLTRTDATTTSGGRYWFIPKRLTSGEIYTWSLYAKGSGYFNIGAEQGGIKNITLTDSYVKYTNTFTANDSSYYQFIFYTPTKFGTITFYGLKLEKGNKATDWTPAPEDLALADHTHSKVQDSNSGADTTFAYSKAGMNYADYSWLAGWNGSELRKIDKSQFAQASHTHSYLPLSGGTMTGSIKFNSNSLPSKTLSFVCGIDAFADGGEMGWQSKERFLSDYSKTNHTHNYAGSSSAGGAANSANVLNHNPVMNYGWNGLNYFNFNGTAGNAAKTNDTPTSCWWHILRFNHGNSAGFYTDLAVPFDDVSLYYKRIHLGSVKNNGWVKVLDALNYTSYTVTKTGSGASGSWGISVTGSSASCTGNAATATALTSNAGSATQPVYFSSGKPVACTYTLGKSVPSNAVFTDTNTWRGIQDNLTSSTNTTESLSAKQGYLLANGSARDNTKLPLSGGTVTGNLTVNGTIKAKNIITGTKTLTLSSAAVMATATLSSSDLGFTPTDNTSIIATIRKNISPTPLYLNIYTTIYNNTVYFCITNGAGSSNVPTGTYYIDYIITNNS